MQPKQGYQAFTKFHHDYRTLVLCSALQCTRGRQHEAEDLAQEVMVRALQNFEILSRLSPMARRAWLMRTLKNLFIDRGRAEKWVVVGLPCHEDGDEPAAREPSEEPMRWERISPEDFRKAMKKLPPYLAQAIELRLSGMKYSEIAKEMGATEGTVGSWLSVARKQLRKLLDEGDKE